MPFTQRCWLPSRCAGKSDVLAALAKLLAENGKEIRAAALKALEVAYEFQGEGMHRITAAVWYTTSCVITVIVVCMKCRGEPMGPVLTDGTAAPTAIPSA